MSTSSSFDFGSSLEIGSSLSGEDNWLMSSSGDGVVYTSKDFGDPRKKSIRNLVVIGFTTVILIGVVILSGELLFSGGGGEDVVGSPYDVFREETLGMMNMEADPCDDFYEYVCGGWLSSIEIPSDKSRFTYSFDTVTKRNEEQVLSILKQGNEKINIIYNNCMDNAELNNRGISAVEAIFSQIDGLTSANEIDEMSSIVANAEAYGVGLLFSSFFEANFFDNSKMTLMLNQISLTLGSREIYLSSTTENQKTITMYVEHLNRAIALLGVNNPDIADGILMLETQLASISADPLYFRNPTQYFNPTTQSELQQTMNFISWDTYFKELGIGSIIDGGARELHITYPTYFKNVSTVLRNTNFTVLKTYMKYKILKHTSEFLGETYQNEFYTLTQLLDGSLEQKSRESRCLKIMNSYFGEILGKSFVESYFPEESKTSAHNMILQIESAFENNIDLSDWMDAETKEAAKDKLNHINNKIGYPDNWRDFTSLEINEGKFFENVLNSINYEFLYQLNQYNTGTDKSSWGMYPHQVNAYYSPVLNEIAFPAGILQRPFFDNAYPAAKNYASIGSVIGHELTHAFDDQGSQFNKDGKLQNWWTNATRVEFNNRAQCIVDQYDKFEIDGMTVNGRLTEGENIADNGGVKDAYAAFMKNNQDTEDLISQTYGFSSEQLFFISYGQIWCSKYRHEYLKHQIETDPHSPGKFRTNGPLQNFNKFKEAFQCTTGDNNMAPSTTCSVW